MFVQDLECGASAAKNQELYEAGRRAAVAPVLKVEATQAVDQG